MSVLDGWLKSAQHALLGPRCLLCAAPAPLRRELCDACLADLPWLEAACRHCALPLSNDASSRACSDCRRRARFDRAVAVFHYAPPIDWLVTRLKFQGRLNHARLLGDLLAKHVHAADLDLPDVLVPVPLHPTGYRRRGFNQAERIAARLAGPIGSPVTSNLLRRTRDTAPQSTLAANRRAANVRDAFTVRAPLAGEHVAIVDDVVTTAHTATAVARTLLGAGAGRVDLYCVARA